MRIFFQGTVADLNGIFYAIAESKVAGDVELNRSEVQYSGGKILFAQVFYSACFFDLACNGRSVIRGNFKLFNNNSFYSNSKVRDVAGIKRSNYPLIVATDENILVCGY